MKIDGWQGFLVALPVLIPLLVVVVACAYRDKIRNRKIQDQKMLYLVDSKGGDNNSGRRCALLARRS